MNVFTEVYNKSIDLLKTAPFDDNWKDIVNKLKILLRDDGPDATKAIALDQLRDLIRRQAKSGTSNGRAEAIITAADVNSPGFQERAALLKTLQHFYLAEKKGSQNMWVVDPPRAYGAWSYDQFSGKLAKEVQTELSFEEEVYGKANRKMMVEALQMSRKWAMDAQIKLASADTKVLTKIKRWFHDSNASDDAVESTRLVLLDGFKKIATVCNSSQVIFSDRPHLRARPDYAKAYASVNKRDVMPVIYIFEAFVKSGKRNIFGLRPEMWNCAITIIHELSHKVVDTEDVKYVFEGMKPGRDLTEAEALKNAESWAFACADIVGVIKNSSLKQALD